MTSRQIEREDKTFQAYLLEETLTVVTVSGPHITRPGDWIIVDTNGDLFVFDNQFVQDHFMIGAV